MRELLILAGSQLDEPAQRDVVLKTFDWYYDRTRILLGVASAVIAGVGIAAASDKLGATYTWGAVGVVGGFALYFVITRILVTPFHREYLTCQVLLHRLQDFQEELRTALEADGYPTPILHGSLARRFVDRDGSVVVDKMRAAHDAFFEASRPRAKQPSTGDAGRYLFAVLGPVPTDEFERRREVQDAVKLHLTEARALSSLPEITS